MRVLRITALGLVGTLVTVVLAASVVLQGSRLGKLIESTLPEQKGKLHIGGVTWRLRALIDIVTDEPSSYPRPDWFPTPEDAKKEYAHLKRA